MLAVGRSEAWWRAASEANRRPAAKTRQTATRLGRAPWRWNPGLTPQSAADQIVSWSPGPRSRGGVRGLSGLPTMRHAPGRRSTRPGSAAMTSGPVAAIKMPTWSTPTCAATRRNRRNASRRGSPRRRARSCLPWARPPLAEISLGRYLPCRPGVRTGLAANWRLRHGCCASNDLIGKPAQRLATCLRHLEPASGHGIRRSSARLELSK